MIGPIEELAFERLLGISRIRLVPGVPGTNWRGDGYLLWDWDDNEPSEPAIKEIFRRADLGHVQAIRVRNWIKQREFVRC